MTKEAMVEEQITFGLDERAAEAITDENDGIHNTASIISRAAEAQERASNAA